MADNQLMALLAAVAEQGSISAAGKSLGISYRTAWLRAEALNNLADKPVLARRAGGRGGGGSTITEHGRALLQAYQRLCLLQSESTADLTGAYPELARFAPVIQHLRLRTSARNQFAGVVEAVHPGAVNTEVTVAVGDILSLRVMVTDVSAHALGLAAGRPVLALVKAPQVLIANEPAPVTSAGNCLPGTIDRIEPGAVNNEVVLTLAGDRSLTASIPSARCDEMALAPGQPAHGLFNGNSVILAVVD